MGRAISAATATAVRLTCNDRPTISSRSGSRFQISEAAALKVAFGRCWDDAGKRFGHLGELLESISPLRVLDRGYVLVEDAAGATVTRAAETTPGQAVSLRFHDDRAGAVIQDGAGKPAQKPDKKPARKKSKKSDDRQGDLL